MEAPIRAIISFIIFFLVGASHSETIRPRAEQLVYELGLSTEPVAARADVMIQSALRASHAPVHEAEQGSRVAVEGIPCDSGEASVAEDKAQNCDQWEDQVAVRFP